MKVAPICESTNKEGPREKRAPEELREDKTLETIFTANYTPEVAFIVYSANLAPRKTHTSFSRS